VLLATIKNSTLIIDCIVAELMKNRNIVKNILLSSVKIYVRAPTSLGNHPPHRYRLGHCSASQYFYTEFMFIATFSGSVTRVVLYESELYFQIKISSGCLEKHECLQFLSTLPCSLR